MSGVYMEGDTWEGNIYEWGDIYVYYIWEVRHAIGANLKV